MFVRVLEACLTFAWWAPCGTSVKGKVDEEVLLWLPRHFLNSCSRRLGPEATWEGVEQCLLKCNLFTPHKEECLGILGSHQAPSSEPLPLSVSAWPLGPWTWCICQLWLKRKHCQLLEGKGRVGTCPSFAAQGPFLSPTSMQSSFQGIFIPTALSLVGNKYECLFPTVESQVIPRQISCQALPLPAPDFQHKS